jgi:hypothetical protein
MTDKDDRDFYDRHVGGLIPDVRVDREVHVVDGTTYAIDTTWLRRRVGFSYWTPRIPRAIRRIREAERRRVAAVAEAHLAQIRGTA